jgi:hypothetical protein
MAAPLETEQRAGMVTGPFVRLTAVLIAVVLLVVTVPLVGVVGLRWYFDAHPASSPAARSAPWLAPMPTFRVQPLDFDLSPWARPTFGGRFVVVDR